MKKLFLLTFGLALMASFAMAQQKKTHGTTHAGAHASGPASFEGTIDFIQSNGIDTSHYKYYVKGNKVKVDNYDVRTKNIEGSFLLDLAAKKTTAISPVRRIYFDQPTGIPVKAGGTPVVKKTGRTKKINGYMCAEYLVTDAQEGVKIYYWLASGHFDFFQGMLKILNRNDKFSEYYLVIPGIEGMFPMLAMEEDMAGNKKGEMKAERVTKTTLSDNDFQVPAGYKEFKK